MENNKIKNKIVKKIEESIMELAQKNPIMPASVKSKPRETVVTFDKSTTPFTVTFSERGFQIGETRLSFEFLETALSKDANIILDKGNGLSLDSIKMEKILKYKDLYK